MIKFLKFFVALTIGFLLFYYIIERAGLESLAKALSLFLNWQGLFVVFLTFLIALVSVLRWKIILENQGVEVKGRNLAKIWTIGFATDYLTPVSLLGGEALRVYLTGKKLNINWENSLSSVIIDKIMDATFHLLFIIGGIVAFLYYGNFPSWGIFWLIVFVITLLLFALIFFYYKVMGRKSIVLWTVKHFGMEKADVRVTKNGKFILNTEGEIIRFFSPKKLFFWKGMTFSFLRHFLIYFRVFVLIFFIAQILDPGKSLAIQGLVNLSLLLPLPAGLGGMEAASAFGFASMGLEFEGGTILGVVWRAADLILCLFGAFFALTTGIHLLKNKTFSFLEKIV